jgi:hypothetical protein
MINTKLQNIIDTKSAIGNAIVNKGGTITGETPFYNYAAQIDSISTGGGAYSTFVAQDQDNAKYTVYNGYDFLTNPTPNLSNNFAFNQWVLNNSATGDVILSNIVVANVGTFNGLNSSINQAIMPFFGNTANYGGSIFSVTTNNGFIYAGGFTNNTVQKFNESTLAFVNNTVSYGNTIQAITTNNGFIYAGGGTFTGTNRGVTKFYESNLALVGANLNDSSTANYGGTIRSIAVNNGFIYAVGEAANTVRKYNESTLALVGNTTNFSETIHTVTTNNGFIYTGGTSNTVRKYYEENLAFVGNTTAYLRNILTITTNNGFIYVGGINQATDRGVGRFYESNLAFVDNTISYGNTINSITINNGFIYVGGQAINTVKKYNESTLAFVGNTVNYGGNIQSVTINNGFIYAGGATNQTVKKFYDFGADNDVVTFYNITTIKE